VRHELKTLPQYFQEVRSRVKTFEVRKHDRDFQIDDILILREWFEEYTDQEEIVIVTYMLTDSQFVKEGYVILGIKKL
jgi:acyl carrier protein phosphodiesterase